MKNKKKNIEMEIYEHLGVKYFKKLVMLLPYGMFRFIFLPEGKARALKELRKFSSNYTLGTITNIDKVVEFRKTLIKNASVHIFGVFYFLLVFPSIDIINFDLKDTLKYVTLFAINAYCVMLQRYNYLRLKPVLEAYKEKKEEIKEELEIEDSKIEDHYYTYHNVTRRKDHTKEITLDEIVDKLSLKDLNELKSYLKLIQDNFTLYSIAQENDKYPLRLQNNKKLNLKLSKDKVISENK